MNTNIKVLLTIILEGGTLVKRVDEKNPTIWNYESKPASLHIKICEEAYYYMISSNFPPFCNRPDLKKAWKKATIEQRLLAHLSRISSHYKGRSYSFEVLEE